MNDLTLLAAPYTPFTASGELNLTVLENYAQFLVDQGVTGIFICGTTGEGMSMTLAERMRLARAWASVLGAQRRLRLIVHAGHACLRDACELARHAETLEADGIAAIGPIFFPPGSVEAEFRIARHIAASAGNTPFYLYHFPAMSRVVTPASELFARVGEGVPTFRGLKFTHNDMADLQRCLDLAEGRYEVYCGRDDLLLNALRVGATAAVGSSYNFAARLSQRISAEHRAGNETEAERLQALAVQALTVIPGIPGGKAVLAQRGIDCGPPRLPLEPLTDAQIREMRDTLEAIGYLSELG